MDISDARLTRFCEIAKDIYSVEGVKEGIKYFNKDGELIHFTEYKIISTD